MRFRTKIFLSAFVVAATSLIVAATLFSWSFRRQTIAKIERTLVEEATLAARLLTNHPPEGGPGVYDEEADAIGRTIRSRVTFIDAKGRVIGDSALAREELPTVENHALRPEVLGAQATGLGRSQRWSTTVDAEMIYVAMPVSHGAVAVVRLALPLTDIRAQTAAMLNGTLLGLLVALCGAGGLAWISSRVLGRRLDSLAAVARRYASGDLSQRAYDRRHDELGSVARVLDDSVQALGARLRELEEERARAETILSALPDGIVVVGGAGTVEIANNAARRMLGLEGDPNGRRLVEVIRHPDLAEQFRLALDGAPTVGVELSLLRAPGRVFVARTTSTRAHGRAGAVLVLHDITDLRRADRVRRDFVANVSHELRTPLTAIRGYVEALLDAPAADPETTRFLETIERHASRMERLVRDLLRLARLDAGQEALQATPCDVAALFTGVASELQQTADSRGQAITIEVGDGAHAVLGDAVKLQDVLRNLVENASNYSPEGSSIELRATAQGDDVLLQVLDDGPGVPDADLDRIFERFYRVDRARSRETGGTGLGLSIVKHLVELHGGSVSAANREPTGAVFTVRLKTAARAAHLAPVSSST